MIRSWPYEVSCADGASLEIATVCFRAKYGCSTTLAEVVTTASVSVDQGEYELGLRRLCAPAVVQINGMFVGSAWQKLPPPPERGF